MSSIQQYSEQELLAKIAEGNPEAFEYLYKTYFSRLAYYAYKITGDDEQSKDISSEILVSISVRRPSFKSLAHLKNYLFLAIRHSALAFKNKRAQEKQLHDEIFYLANEADQLLDLEQIQAEVIAEIQAQVQSLPKGCAEVFKLVYFERKSTAEVAEMLNISIKTVLNQRQTAARLLKSSLLKKGLLPLLLWLIGKL